MEQMKTRRFAILLACILCTTILVLFYGDPQPSLHHLVAKTQTKISHWNALQSNEKIEKIPDPEDKFLKGLGFTSQPRLYPSHVWNNVSLPVFVTAVLSSDTHLVIGFLKSFQHYFPESLVILYEMDLNPSDSSLVATTCNSSSCETRIFDFHAYPAHVQNLQLFAYRPIIIQEVINQAGAVIWIDIHYSFTSGEIQGILNQAQKAGLVSWSINQPTTALTHPRMFDYFKTKQENFFFHRMVEPSFIVLYNVESIHLELMLPWVKCALVSNCIAPIGAQNSGCRFDKKPMYRYSGCHRYDMSALNVALGLMFDYSASRYAAREEDKFFHRIEIDKESISDSDKNSTVFFHDFEK